MLLKHSSHLPTTVSAVPDYEFPLAVVDRRKMQTKMSSPVEVSSESIRDVKVSYRHLKVGVYPIPRQFLTKLGDS